MHLWLGVSLFLPADIKHIVSRSISHSRIKRLALTLTMLSRASCSSPNLFVPPSSICDRFPHPFPQRGPFSAKVSYTLFELFSITFLLQSPIFSQKSTNTRCVSLSLFSRLFSRSPPPDLLPPLRNPLTLLRSRYVSNLTSHY